VLGKPNAEPALRLLQNMCCDKAARSVVLRADGVALLLRLLESDPAAVKQERPAVAAHLAGSLLNLLAPSSETAAAKHAFVKASGLQIACKVREGSLRECGCPLAPVVDTLIPHQQALAAWGRYDTSMATQRLRLLLADIGKLAAYAPQLQAAALDACNSARSRAAYAGRHPDITSDGLDVSADVIAGAGRGVVLGTQRMPASERIAASVLTHGKDLAAVPVAPPATAEA
jgi:hypothetical protein